MMISVLGTGFCDRCQPSITALCRTIAHFLEKHAQVFSLPAVQRRVNCGISGANSFFTESRVPTCDSDCRPSFSRPLALVNLLRPDSQIGETVNVMQQL